ncbi:hypothetical protein Hanom_Chr17g01568471 [Helianthus anomalus]
MMFFSRAVIACRGYSEVGLLDILLLGFSSWMSTVRPKQRLLKKLFLHWDDLRQTCFCTNRRLW